MQTPKLGRLALLTLVDWITKYKNRSAYIETHGVGTNPTTKSLSINQPIGSNSAKEIKNNKS
jgi:hypothetical protein